MIIGRFKVTCRPDRVDEVVEAIAAVEAPSREIDGVVHFDVVRSVTDPNTLLAFEVFATREAFDRQNAQPVLASFLGLLDAGAAVGGFEWTTWETADA